MKVSSVYYPQSLPVQFNAMNLLSLSSLLFSLIATTTAAPAELAKRAGRTSTPSGCLTVRGSGTKSGEYSTLGAALTQLDTSATTAACIFIYSGTYQEQVTIQYKGALTIYGYATE
jgi:pectinesterase